MPRRRRALKTLFEIELQPSPEGSRDAARNLHRQLHDAIRDGRLPAGARLPPTREAQAYFGVSRNTAAEVYERLTNDGLIAARGGSGTFVRATTPPAPIRRSARRTVAAQRVNPFWLRDDVQSAMGFWRDSATAPSTRATRSVDLRPALVDSRLFPYDVFRRVATKQLRALERKPASFKSPQGNQGNFHLRTAITQHIALTRAVVCTPDDVLVTSGAQQAFDLLARVLVVPGETVVAVEDPGYPPMRVAFAAAGAKLVPVGVDAEGLLVDAIPREARVICLCPSHQFPLGVTTSARRRAALLEFARRNDAVIVEDDYDGEFRYEANPLTALRTPEAADVVFYVGTFSKCMLPMLRLGFLVAPDWALPALIAAKNCLDWHTATPVQLSVAGFIAEGHLARHVRRMRGVYAQRRELLLSLLDEQLAPWLEPVASGYGMHIGALARRPLDLEQVTRALARRQIQLHTLSRYYLGAQTRAGLIFGYGAVGLAEIRQGLSALRDALRG